MKTMMWMRGRTLWKQQRGLTLFELLGVLIIVGIIAAIAVPAIAGVIKQSEVDADNRTRERIANAAELYLNARDITGDCLLDSDTAVNLANTRTGTPTPTTNHLNVTCVTSVPTSYGITATALTGGTVVAKSTISVKFLAEEQYFEAIPVSQVFDQPYWTVTALYIKGSSSNGTWVVPDTTTNKYQSNFSTAQGTNVPSAAHRVISIKGFTQPGSFAEYTNIHN